MANTPVSNLPIVALSDVPDAGALSSGLTTALDHLVLPKYATTAARDAANPTPTQGDTCYVSGTGRGYYHYSGSAWIGPYQRDQGWISYTPTWTTTTGSHTPSIGNAVQNWSYKQEGKLVFIFGQVTFGSTTNFGSGATGSDNWTFSLPVTPDTTFSEFNMQFLVNDSSVGSGRNMMVMGHLSSANGLALNMTSSWLDGTDPIAFGLVDSTQPMTWASGDFLKGGGFYIAA